MSSLPGIIDSAYVRPEDIPGIKAADAFNKKEHLVPLKNLGIQTVVERDTICVILKDSSFRPPPFPTIYMVEEQLQDAEGEAQCETLSPKMLLQVAGRKYRIVGEEVLDKKKGYSENHMFFESDFVLFPDRRKNRQNVPAFFLLPPIPFPELEKEKDKLSIANIMSISPSTQGDEFLRSAYNFSKNPEYATILIGWDLQGAGGDEVF